MKYKIVFGALAVAFFLVPVSTLALTIISGNIAPGTVWTKAESPYLLSAPINIPVGSSLTIEPGVIVKPGQPNIGFSVSGTLNVLGSISDPIYFTSINDDSIGGHNGSSQWGDSWDGIVINSGASANFNYAILKNGGYSCAEILNLGGTLTVLHSEITNSANFGIVHSGGTTMISQSSIHNNNGYGVYNSIAEPIDAKNNWWGSTVGPYHSLLNIDGLGNNRVSDYVDFIPFLMTDPAKTTPVSNILSDSTETEDDGLIDAKGVADKTNFTFSIDYTGTTDDVTLWANDGTESKSYPLTKIGESYSHIRTFPKGHYSYHYEANGGVVRFPENGELGFTTGYSNVAFLPGIKASRLFNQKIDCFVNCEDQLWEPNWYTDTAELMLNPDGSSENANIYTKTDPYLGTIDQANVLAFPDILRENFYVSFIDSMNALKTSNEINDWKALPYDWRLAFSKILSGGKEDNGRIYYDDVYSTDAPYLLSQIRNLANTSDTGKVTIIGHSMGGLLAKKILHDYQDIASSTETLILVDTPQLGTPQAIATMLHGTGENLPDKFGLFTDAVTGRLVAQNMKSAYTLLPSKEYFNHVNDFGKNYTTLVSQDSTLRTLTGDPLFNANSVLDYYKSKYSTTTITTYGALADFLTGKDGHSSAPDGDIIHPKVILMDMLEEAQTLHDEIDNWVPPEKMRVVQIAGWGIPETIRGINYIGKVVPTTCPPSFTGSCTKTVFGVEPLFTFDGDGTVVVPSQVAMNTETYYVDLNGYNNSMGNQYINFQKNRSHGSILEVKSVRNLIENIFKEIPNPSNGLGYVKTDPNLLIPNNLTPLIRLSLHSPVKIDITDTDGNHVGISTKSTVTNTLYDTQMPNSYYLEMGEGKYLGFPLETGTKIQLQGTGTGTFTLNLEQYQEDTKEETQTFTDIPVNPLTKATLTINTLNDAKELSLDQNGDGIIDSVVFTDENEKTITFQTLKNEIQTLPEKTRKELLENVEPAEKQFNKENYDASKAQLSELKKEITEVSKKKEKGKYVIDQTEGLRISAIVDTLINQIDLKIKEIEKKKHCDDKKVVEKGDGRR